MVQEKNNVLDSGFTRYQANSALKNAQTSYELSRKENMKKVRSIMPGHCTNWSMSMGYFLNPSENV